MRKEIKPTEEIPPFYGVAYTDYSRGIDICYPLWINLIIVLWRDFVYWLKIPKR